MYNRCVEAVGVNNIHLFFFEGFQKDYKQELRRLSSFINPNEDYDFIDKLINDKIGDRSLDFKKDVFEMKLDDISSFLDGVQDNYALSNQKLHDKFQVSELSKYGYLNLK
jgi:hypothetical protein